MPLNSKDPDIQIILAKLDLLDEKFSRLLSRILSLSSTTEIAVVSGLDTNRILLEKIAEKLDIPLNSLKKED